MTFPLFTGKPTRTSTCTDQRTLGTPSFDWSYPVKGLTGDINYPIAYGACPPMLHYWMRLNRLKVDLDIVANTTISAAGSINTPLYTGGAMVGVNISACTGKKDFDIPHPKKDGWRLRHVCIEGPTADVYVRGKLKGTNVIKLPDYWEGLVDLESIDVSLTPMGHYQELFVESINWGKNIVVKNNSGGAINCSYVVYGERIDTSKNIPEYEGEYKDYPGDNSEYTGSAIVEK